MTTVKDYDLFNRLARTLNYSHGTTGPGTARQSSQKANLVLKNEEIIQAKYQSIVSFTSDKYLDSLMQKFRGEGMSLIKAALEKAVSDHEKQFEGKTLSFEINMDTSHDDVEYIHFNMHNPVRRAMYRLSCLIEVTEKDG